MGPAVRNVIKAIPLGVVLPGALAMMAVSPNDAMSNIAKWLNAVGIHQVPEWLAGNLGDSRFLGICIVLSIVYAGFVWGARAALAAPQTTRNSAARPYVSHC